MILFSTTVHCTESIVNVVSYGSNSLDVCVRVIMGVVNCRLDYKQFVLWYCSVTQFTVQWM